MIRSIFVLALLATPTMAAPPNVVMLIGDDQGYADYGFMGNATIKTPNLDKLAAQGLVFKRGYVPSSLCRPSLATMVTGLYPHQHLITSNDPPLAKGKAKAPAAKKDEKWLAMRAEMVANFEKSPSLAKLLGEQGFISHQSGKWWEGNACRCGGFTEGMTHGDPTKGGRHGDLGLTIGRQGVRPVLDFLDKAKAENKPFYLWYAPMMPHSPHNPPERLLAKYKDKSPSIHVAKYWAMCEWFDETLGEILDRLEKNGQAENTIVVYLHDNGWIQDPTKDAFAPRSKQSQYDGGLRTPILVRWPGHVKPGVDDTHPVSSIDVVPTILAATGVKPSKDMPGVNLMDAAAVANRDTLYGACFTHNAVDIHDPAKNVRWRWVLSDGWKLIVPDAKNEADAKVELYQVTKDPGEKNNLAADSAKVAELTKKLDAWWPAK